MANYLVDPMKCGEDLAGAVRFATVSTHHEADIDFEPFYQLHKYLEETFPLVHKTMEKEVIGKAALLFHWKGTGKSANKPLLFMAHQDVVPEADHEGWKYPPFSGTIADGYVWGRGASDCKSSLIAQLETFEYLIGQGFTPDFDIYMAYGYNEEVAGGDSDSAADLAAKTLAARGIHCDTCFDEGSGLSDGKSNGLTIDSVSITVAEKGYIDAVITREDPGGHSAMPHKDGALDYVAKAILGVSNNQYPYRVIEPVRQKYLTLAPYMTENGDELAAILSEEPVDMDKLAAFLEDKPRLAPFFRTTMVPTMASGSPQGNILPTKASVTVNCRLLPGDTIDSVLNHIRSVVPEGMTVVAKTAFEASPFSDVNSKMGDLLKEICKEEYFEDVKVYPNMSIGGTDARYMYGVADNVYRFAPFNSVGVIDGNEHSYNENQNIYSLAAAVNFYAKIVTRWGER